MRYLTTLELRGGSIESLVGVIERNISTRIEPPLLETPRVFWASVSSMIYTIIITARYIIAMIFGALLRKP
jgi:hypothetical protein